MNNISAVIVIKNNPSRVFEMLSSIDDFVLEIIIGSISLNTNLENKLLQNKKIKIVKVDNEVPFADMVKEDLKKEARGEYILYLDPDEIFPQDVKLFLKDNLDKYDYFIFPRKNIIFGKWIRHSRWWPDHQLRLFKKNSLIWPKTIHPVPKPKGKGYSFKDEEKNSIMHYNYDNLDQYLEKTVRYAKSEAEYKIKNNEEFSINVAIKLSLSEFISRFFAYEGYRDGMHGFSLAILQMFYYFLVYFYYWEEKKYFVLDQDKLLINSENYFHLGLKEINYWLIKKKLVSFWKRIKLKVLNKILNT